MSQRAHRLAALWFADIVGYTGLAARDEGEAMAAVETLQKVARRVVVERGGRVVKFVGDSVMAEFPSADGAVRSAIETRDGFAVEVGARGLEPRELRVGVHVGEVVATEDGDVYGDGVNLAARIQSVTAPGEVWVSEDVWRLLRQRPELRFEARRERDLKGVAAPVALYAAETQEPGAPRGARRATPAKHSVAVLPFADLSPDHDQEYFSDGIAEEILDALTRLSGLRVPARTSCFAFKGQNADVREIGARLGVEAILEGSVRKAGSRLRITAQLVDVRNGYHLWSRRFDRELSDVFAIQEEIARSIVEALQITIGEPEERVLRPLATTPHVEAYELYLRGRHYFQKWTRRNAEFARRMFERAIAVDPRFAGAWAGLATACVHLFRWGRDPSDLEAAGKASARALELDPGLAEGHVAEAQRLSIQRQYDEAAVAFERAIALDPTYFEAWYYYARSAFEAGAPEKSVHLYEEAHRVRTDDYQPLALMTLPLKELDRHDEAQAAERRALEAVEKHLALHPDDARAHSLGAGTLANLGDGGRARRWAEQSMALAPDDPVILYNAACTLAALGEDELALDGLERAIEARISNWDWFRHDPDWDRLRDHPRFRALMERIAPT